MHTPDIAYQRQVAKATRHHQKTPFSTKKEIRRGGISKNKAKGFSGGGAARLAVLGGAAEMF